uniref:Uncharacterized protein n=1 Tax=Timema douglasi TaxID=61478 RepID=A0A7R8VEI6_TIMDO|nr:unnamed protein product [Timema douglasi]
MNVNLGWEVGSGEQEVYRHFHGGRVENRLEKITLSTPDCDHTMQQSSIIILVYCESSALDHDTIEADRMKDGVSAGVRHVDPVLRRACLAAPLLHSSPTAALPLHVDGDSVPPASATTASTQETLFNPHGVRVTSIAPKKPWSYCTNHKTFELTPSHVTWTSKEFDSGDSSPRSRRRGGERGSSSIGGCTLGVGQVKGRITAVCIYSGFEEWSRLIVSRSDTCICSRVCQLFTSAAGAMEMKVVTLLTCLVACSQGGLLRVPRVYNALITSNERLLPSRAYPVSSPLLAFYPVITDPYLALPPEGRYLAAPPSTPGDSTPAPESEDTTTTTTPAPASSTTAAVPVSEPFLVPLGSPYSAPLTLPFSYYSPLSYSPFSYYPSFLSYSYLPGYEAFPLSAGHEKQTPTIPEPENSVKNNKPKENSAIPDVLPPSPSGGTVAPSEEGKDSAPVKAS